MIISHMICAVLASSILEGVGSRAIVSAARTVLLVSDEAGSCEEAWPRNRLEGVRPIVFPRTALISASLTAILSPKPLSTGLGLSLVLPPSSAAL